MMGRRARFLVDTAAAKVLRLIHSALRWDQAATFSGHRISLPPGHKLPGYQRLVETYDRYAAGEIRRLCGDRERPVLIDVGANVGDTTVLALVTVPQIRSIAVEGDERFLAYLSKNIRGFETRVTIVPAFVAPAGQAFAYQGNRTTGQLREHTGATANAIVSIQVEELWRHAEGADFLIWKSDTDGLDIELLRTNWQDIDARCDVIWFEFDPNLDIASGAGIPALATLIAGSGRRCTIFDNYGRKMTDVSGCSIADVMCGLRDWLQAEDRLPNETAYLDVWAVRESLIADA